ncbi:TonB-dependent receptor [Aestuariibaculum sp. M13]|uniref:SusC/RagA family TonB-linked outer membrane protein n=1 Tax=Aestuariibaculum sp. M13 TaxID=2967132 RepID=UPI002159E482|nr:TonB-dependent receptor [Aestuariibaculum sp. M13]MCR8667884.1 TonB-dependent receptor [Aestuariibaculum sp. M13]
MRTFIFFFCTAVFAIIPNHVVSQNSKIEIKEDKVLTVDEVFDLIMSQTEYKFIYEEGMFDNFPKVEVKKGVIKTRDLLTKSLPQTNCEFIVTDGKGIIVKPKPKVSTLMQQKFPVSGTITDANGQPLPGANVLEKGTTNGAQSDFDGNFSLEVSDLNTTIVVSYVGFKSQEYKLNGESQIKVVLQEDAAALDEVVVVGYGAQRKSDLISSVSKVETADLVKVPSSDVGEMLRGKAPGVLISTSDASPGSSTTIQIRGKRSINGGNDPLVIVDGVQVTSLNDVNPNDISSMEVLKDAAAQAIYGARASNGVILITTERGKEGKVQVNFNGYTGVQSLQKHFDTYNGDEFIAYKREAFRASNGGVFLPDDQVFSASELETIASGDYINWEDKIINNSAVITNGDVSVSAGSEKTKVYSSFNYLKQEGLIKGSEFNRGQIRLNLDQKINEWFTVGLNTSYQISEKDNPGVAYTDDAASMLLRSITTSPLGQVYNDDGSLKIHPSEVQDSFNPLLDLNEITNNIEDKRDIVNVFLDVKPFKGLNYRFNASRNTINRKSIIYNSSKSLLGIQAGGFGLGSITYDENKSWQLENIFNYDFDFKNDNHNLNLTFVQSVLNTQTTSLTNQASNFPNDNLGIYGIASAGTNQTTISGLERNLVSFVARGQYNFGGKYYLTASMRADGSSVFGDNNKWGYFPAVGAGWNVHKEDFLSDSAVNNLKLRASYGSVGNEGIQPYQSLNTLIPRDYIINGVKTAGLLPGPSLPNPDLKWETSTTLNLAIDYGFLENRISGTVEFYNTRTKDLLVDRALEAVSGYSISKTNVGEIENQGIEASFNADIIRKKDFTLSAGIVVNSNRNKIISLYGEDKDGDGREDDDVANQWFIGQPIDVYYDYLYQGIFSSQDQIDNSNTPNAELGDIQVWDRDPNDGELNGDDRVITSQAPDWYGTFTLNMEYKNFDFSSSLYTVQGVTKFNPFLVDYQTGGNPRGILSGVKVNYWTPENPTGDRPRPLEARGRRFMDSGNVTAGLEDASFFRLQNVTLGYSLSDSILENLKLSKLRFYVTGQNLITVTDFQSFSPENDAYSYPEAISVTAGIQVGF